jgi:site-specific recombinase XerD
MPRAPAVRAGALSHFQAMVERAARAAGFDMEIHPHMLRL